MVIIRVNARIPAAQAQKTVEGIHLQAPTGVIVLPSYCELLNEVPGDEQVQVMYEDGRVAELEKELAQERQRAHDMRERLCRHCRNAGAPASQSACWACDSGELFRL